MQVRGIVQADRKHYQTIEFYKLYHNQYVIKRLFFASKISNLKNFEYDGEIIKLSYVIYNRFLNLYLHFNFVFYAMRLRRENPILFTSVDNKLRNILPKLFIGKPPKIKTPKITFLNS